MSESDASVHEFKVYTSRLGCLDQRIRRINDRMNGNGRLSYSLVGEEFEDDCIDSKGNTYRGMYHIVAISGVVKVKGMSCIGRVSFVDNEAFEQNKAVIHRYSADISEEDAKHLYQPHDRSCACCDKKVGNRLTFYEFRCDEDTTIKTSGDNPRSFKKGQYYQVASSCVDNFLGKEALKAVNGLVGTYDERERSYNLPKEPDRYDADLLMKYILAVGKLHIDDAYNYYKHNYSVQGIEYGVGYNRHNSYRLCHVRRGKTPHGVFGGITDGTIIKTAKTLYIQRELNPDFYNLDFFAAPKRMGVDANKAVLDRICNLSGFDELLRSDEIDNLKNEILHSDTGDAVIENYADRKGFIRVNKTALSSSVSVNRNLGQMLVDLGDDYLLSQGHGWLHEAEGAKMIAVKTERDDYTNVIHTWKEDLMGKKDWLKNPSVKRLSLNDLLDKIVQKYHIDHNDRIVDMFEEFDVVPDDDPRLHEDSMSEGSDKTDKTDKTDNFCSAYNGATDSASSRYKDMVVVESKCLSDGVSPADDSPFKDRVISSSVNVMNAAMKSDGIYCVVGLDKRMVWQVKDKYTVKVPVPASVSSYGERLITVGNKDLKAGILYIDGVETKNLVPYFDGNMSKYALVGDRNGPFKCAVFSNKEGRQEISVRISDLAKLRNELLPDDVVRRDESVVKDVVAKRDESAVKDTGVCGKAGFKAAKEMAVSAASAASQPVEVSVSVSVVVNPSVKRQSDVSIHVHAGQDDAMDIS